MGTDFTDIIQYIVSTKKHPLHRYINFDNGLPGHIFRCTCGLEEPNADDYDALLDLGWEDTARGFLLDTCPALASELVVYGLIGHGSKLINPETSNKFAYTDSSFWRYPRCAQSRKGGGQSQTLRHQSPALYWRQKVVLGCIKNLRAARPSGWANSPRSTEAPLSGGE